MIVTNLGKAWIFPQFPNSPIPQFPISLEYQIKCLTAYLIYRQSAVSKKIIISKTFYVDFYPFILSLFPTYAMIPNYFKLPDLIILTINHKPRKLATAKSTLLIKDN